MTTLFDVEHDYEGNTLVSMGLTVEAAAARVGELLADDVPAGSIRVVPAPGSPAVEVPGFTAEAIAAAVEQVKGEIIDDAKDGTVPVDVEDFSALHSHVDANMYGGEAADALWDDLLDHGDAARQGIDPYRGLNAMQDAVDQWIKAGGLRAAVAPATE